MLRHCDIGHVSSCSEPLPDFGQLINSNWSYHKAGSGFGFVDQCILTSCVEPHYSDCTHYFVMYCYSWTFETAEISETIRTSDLGRVGDYGSC